MIIVLNYNKQMQNKIKEFILRNIKKMNYQLQIKKYLTK